MTDESRDEPRLGATPAPGAVAARRRAPRASILEYGLIAALIAAAAVAAATLVDRPYAPQAPGAVGGGALTATPRGGA